jgi:hypothetical protein
MTCPNKPSSLAKFNAGRRASSLPSLAVDRWLARTSIPLRRRVATNAAFTELSAALWRQIANISKQTGFYARLVRNVGGAKMQGVTCASHIGAGAGSAKDRTQQRAEQRHSQ